MRHFRQLLLLAVAVTLASCCGQATAQQAGTFSAGVLSSNNTVQSEEVLKGDFNNDGKMDVITFEACSGGCGQSAVSVRFGNGDGTFQAPIHTITGPGNLRAMAVGDFNGDGKLDVAALSDQNSSGTLAIFLGNGDGTFTQSASYLFNGITSQPFTVAVADLDGDGIPDLVATAACYNILVNGCSVGAILIYPGAGDGTFGTPQVFTSTGNQAIPVAIADLNGDGKLDVVAGATSRLTVLLNKGNGTFTETDVPLPFGPGDIVVADFNGDGIPDVATSTSNSPSMVMFGNGDGTFQAPVQYLTFGEALSVADFNGDGKPDLLVSSNPFVNEADLLINDGTGTFQITTYPLGGWGSGSNVTADFNGDGHVDVLLSSGCSESSLHGCPDGTLGVLLGNGDGTMRAASVLEIPLALGSFNGAISAVLVNDLNGDGIPDVVRIDTNTNAVSELFVSLGTGGGAFAPPVAIPIGTQIEAITGVTGDFNGDGIPDVAVVTLCTPTTCTEGGVLVMLGNGDGTFLPPVAYSTGAVLSQVIAVGDVNGDGKLDLIAGSQCASQAACGGETAISLLLGNGDGTFQPANVVIMPFIELATGIVATDLNGDGRADIAVAGPHIPGAIAFVNNYVDVFLGNSDGTLSFASSSAAGGTITQAANFSVASVAAGDVNGDGIPDLVITNPCGFENTNGFNPCTGGAIGVLAGNGDGTFQPATSSLVFDANFGSANLKDVSGDGKLDLIAATLTGVYVAAGNGDGTFQQGTVYASLEIRSGATLAIADMNGDGSPDIISPGYKSLHAISATAILFNRGTFGPATAPDLTITKSHIGNFTQGQIGATYTITATNSGSAPTTGTITVSDTLPVGLAATGLTGPAGWTCSLAPLQCTTTTVLAVTSSVQFTLTVNVANNAASPLTNTATVAGGGEVNTTNDSATDPTTIIVATPIVTLSATSLTFANQTVGTPSAPQVVTLTNTGTGALNIASIAVTGDNSQTNNCGPTVAAGASCTINVTFKPTAPGARTGVLSVTDNAAGSPQSVTLSGTGVTPVTTIATLAPASLTFAAQVIGSTSVAQSVTLTNSGTGTLLIGSIAFSGTNPGDFVQTNACGSSVAPATNCIIRVSFKPIAAGTRRASLVVTDNAAGSPQTVVLTGTATAPTVSLSSATANFGKQRVGTTTQQTITLQNNGNGALLLSSIVIAGTNPGDFAQTNNCGVSLAARGRCTLSVTFRPQAVGTRAATLIISDNAVNTPQRVALTGVGR